MERERGKNDSSSNNSDDTNEMSGLRGTAASTGFDKNRGHGH